MLARAEAITSFAPAIQLNFAALTGRTVSNDIDAPLSYAIYFLICKPKFLTEEHLMWR